MTLRKVLNPLEVIAQRYGMFAKGKETITKAYYDLDYKGFKEVVKRAYYQGGWHSPVDKSKSFPQVVGEDYFRKNIEVKVAIQHKDKTIAEEVFEYSLDDLCNEIIKLIERD